MNKRIIGVMAAAGASLLVSGCANSPYQGPGFLSGVTKDLHNTFASSDPCSHNDRNIGVVAGTVAGAMIGHAIKHNREGTLIGAAIGAGTGGLIGNEMDNRRCALYKIAKANNLKMASQLLTPKQLGTSSAVTTKPNSAVGLDVQFQNQSDEFVQGTALLTPKARRYFSEMAKEYAPGKSKQNHKVLIVAHTSQNGGNQVKLTRERARAVAEVFKQNGVPSRDIYFQGAGDALPIASNASAQGQEENRRIEIVDVPTTNDLKHYLSRRQVNPEYFKKTRSTPAGTRAEKKPAEHQKPKVARHESRHGTHEKEIAAWVRHYHNRYRYDFGGKPVRLAGAETVSLGESTSTGMFNFFVPTAHAASQVTVNSCLNDRPREAGPVRNLATDRELPVRDYMPGFYGAPWLGGFNGNLVVVEDDYIPRDSGSPVPQPKFIVYPHYKGNAKARPGYDARAEVNVYRGSKATLYRMFVNGPAECVDLIKPAGARLAQVKLYYEKKDTQYVATGKMAIKN